jgi:DNA replication and repair protein RecF
LVEKLNYKLLTTNYQLTMNILSLERLTLSYFRNYPSLRLELSPQPVIITGNNGAGKTNILEAVSFLSPGRGLRSSSLQEIDMQGGGHPWAVASVVHSTDGLREIGTGRLDSAGNKRLVKIDGQLMRGQTELSALFSVIWLTPQMDQIFISASALRRRFLDRLVFNFDPNHAQHMARYDHSMRERARLLKEPRPDPEWLTILEHKMAEMGGAIAASRRQTVEYLQQTINSTTSPFPKAGLALLGEIETALGKSPALEVEDYFRRELARLRSHDAMSGRTNLGIHRSDLSVTHSEKNMPAALCSTGEQKALLISIILAEAKARITWRHSVPVLLLDEIIAHLDSERREALLADILSMNAQAWITGTDERLFSELKNHAQFMRIEEGTLSSKEPAFATHQDSPLSAHFPE